MTSPYSSLYQSPSPILGRGGSSDRPMVGLFSASSSYSRIGGSQQQQQSQSPYGTGSYHKPPHQIVGPSQVAPRQEQQQQQTAVPLSIQQHLLRSAGLSSSPSPFNDISRPNETLPSDLEEDLEKMQDRVYGGSYYASAQPHQTPSPGHQRRETTSRTPVRATAQTNKEETNRRLTYGRSGAGADQSFRPRSPLVTDANHPSESQVAPPPPPKFMDVGELQRPNRPRVLDWVLNQAKQTKSEIADYPPVPSETGRELHDRAVLLKERKTGSGRQQTHEAYNAVSNRRRAASASATATRNLATRKGGVSPPQIDGDQEHYDFVANLLTGLEGQQQQHSNPTRAVAAANQEIPLELQPLEKDLLAKVEAERAKPAPKEVIERSREARRRAGGASRAAATSSPEMNQRIVSGQEQYSEQEAQQGMALQETYEVVGTTTQGQGRYISPPVVVPVVDGSTEMEPLTGGWNGTSSDGGALTAVIPRPEQGHDWLDQHGSLRHTNKEIAQMKDRFKQQFTGEAQEEAARRRERRRAKTPRGTRGWRVENGKVIMHWGDDAEREALKKRKLSPEELFAKMNAPKLSPPQSRGASPENVAHNSRSSHQGGGLTDTMTLPSSYLSGSKLSSVKCRVPSRYVKSSKRPVTEGCNLITAKDWTRIERFSKTPWQNPYARKDD